MIKKIFFGLFLSVTLTQAQAATIHISKALLLNADRKFIADITKKVKAKDNVWAVIHDGEYVRVTFEQALDRHYDNSIYARPISAQAIVEVYPVYTDQKGERIELSRITAFPIIKHEGFYKVLLTKLQVPTSTFDFKITGGVDIDYIVDPTYTVLYNIGSINFGQHPDGLILSGSTLYGMTQLSGTSNDGIIFSIATTGGSFTVLHDFTGSGTDGSFPEGSLILSGTTLYGMALDGGPSGLGIIFSIATTGGALTDLHNFSGSSTDGGFPEGFLTLSGSTLYGMTNIGGASSSSDGIIFSIATTGGSFTDLHDFSGSSTDGGDPNGSLTLSGSTLYGMTDIGGASNEGIIFSIATTGGSFTDLHNFSGSSTDGSGPAGDLTLSGSTLYGMTDAGGFSGMGIIFSIATTGGALTDLHNFSGSSTDGSSPSGDLTLSGSTLYGIADDGGASNKGIIFSIATTGGALTDLHNFSGSSTDGSNPRSFIILSGSTLYGASASGGASGSGMIFSIATTGGALTDLFDFIGNVNGNSPFGSLISSGGTLYGMTQFGGPSNKGIIFSIITTGGSFTVLHDFSGSSTDGSQPFGDLTLSGSTLYGMTANGGPSNDGIIFSIATTGGSFTNLHNFSGSSVDGSFPTGSLTLSGSTLYSMTEGGGASNDGIIFSIATTGGPLTDLHNFSGGNFDASGPEGSLTLSGSTLYGMAELGGTSNLGIIFSIATTGGPLTDLHNFSGSSTDGYNPSGSLTLSGSTLYGMAAGGAFSYGLGIIFSIATTGGPLTDLHNFSGSSTDGNNVSGNLTFLGNTLYGMTSQGGASNLGIIFSMATTGGSFTDLHDFSGGSTDGSGPGGSLNL